MLTLNRLYLNTVAFLILFVQLCRPVCVDVPSDTEAVIGTQMRLTCISCMKREEVKARTLVNWFYFSDSGDMTHIYKYENTKETDLDGPFKGRLAWNGSKDLQDLSIVILNVTLNDSGLYQCEVSREFDFRFFTPTFFIRKNITLTVKERASEDTTAIYSEIMMYVLLVFLTFWLLVEMVYCYRKISKSDDQAQDTATNYLAIPSEQKDNPAAAVTE
ncbi:sodium channel subunit beta-3 isoform X1 [Oryzias latipes]|uniref:Sodium channel regulatory subunit beta-3 n=1 Tax=Oryzias latipes TaxID=8090 RepID=H2LTM1_ORYLA|nr:sodium channel subunit beta-3 isoform X1 [Oryzias latipes]